MVLGHSSMAYSKECPDRRDVDKHSYTTSQLGDADTDRCTCPMSIGVFIAESTKDASLGSKQEIPATRDIPLNSRAFDACDNINARRPVLDGT